MAGDWIKFETATIDKPEIWVLSDALDRTPEAVIGHLLRFWVWANRQSHDGNAVVTQLSTVDRVANCTGIGDALLSTGWLVKVQGGYSIPNFDRHNGNSAKKRALAKNRMESHRSRNRDAGRNAPVTPTASPEKRRVVPITNTTVTRKRPVDKSPTGEGSPTPFTDLIKKAQAKGEIPKGLTPPEPKPEVESEPASASTPAKSTPAPGNGQLPDDWTDTAEAIDQAGQHYGMARLPFEADEAYVKRIEQRRALG